MTPKAHEKKASVTSLRNRPTWINCTHIQDDQWVIFNVMQRNYAASYPKTRPGVLRTANYQFPTWRKEIKLPLICFACSTKLGLESRTRTEPSNYCDPSGLAVFYFATKEFIELSINCQKSWYSVNFKRKLYRTSTAQLASISFACSLRNSPTSSSPSHSTQRSVI